MLIKTEISLAFQKKLRKRGYLYSSAGALLLFIGANVLAVQTLEKVGLWIFLTAIVCIYIGLKPYSEAKKRLMFPDEILIEEKNLIYLLNKKIAVSIPIQNISKIFYQEKKVQYGIQVLIKKEPTTHFLPYFSKNALKKLLAHAALQGIVHSD